MSDDTTLAERRAYRVALQWLAEAGRADWLAREAWEGVAITDTPDGAHYLRQMRDSGAYTRPLDRACLRLLCQRHGVEF